MSEKPAIYLPIDPVARIISVRGQRVILDADLTAVYGVETRVLKQAVRRNLEKFPVDFMFSLTRAEARSLAALRS